jgi:tetratricopeptide (TPR) repeat protein
MSKKNQHQDPEQSVEQALNTTEHFIEKNKKTLMYSAIAIIAIAAIGFAYQHLYRKPLINEALAQTFMAEQHFRSDSFALALNGDGNSLGFAQIIDEYGSKAGESVYMYAGISELQLGNYENAISYLKKYDGNDPIMKARSISNIGDAYAGLENYKEALSFYLKAADLLITLLLQDIFSKPELCTKSLEILPRLLRHTKQSKINILKALKVTI